MSDRKPDPAGWNRIEELERRIRLVQEEIDSNGMYTVQKSVVRRLLDLPRKIEVEEPTPALDARHDGMTGNA